MSDYSPVNYNSHDKLLHHATRRELVELGVASTDGRPRMLKVLIRDVYTSKSEEFALLSNGERVRLDQIVSLNGEPFVIGKSQGEEESEEPEEGEK